MDKNEIIAMVVEKLKTIEAGKEISLKDLVGNELKKYTSADLAEIVAKITKLCEEKNIKLNVESLDQYKGLLSNLPFDIPFLKK
ncbi:MAG: hypothetical protein IJS47_00115 [Clostridia bacterium]|nr:hypothetical protein [Clostridia bacterium]